MARKRGKNNKLVNNIVIWALLLLVSAMAAAIVIKFFDIPCANSISCLGDLSGNYRNEDGIFMGHKIHSVPQAFMGNRGILGESNAEKHIYVDLTNQKLTAYEGEKLMFDFPVSTGKWGRTPTGDFKIWSKLLYTRMEGGSGSDYYNLPNVPHTMFFYNDKVAKSKGFALHGAYWHNNFGYPMSHGCVNIRPEDAANLFEWANPVSDKKITQATMDNPGTAITISGETPI